MSTSSKLGLFGASIGDVLRDGKWRAIFLWCLPALIVGFVLRACLWGRMPDAFYHPDSDQVFDTYRLLLNGGFGIHEKKTPLGPLLYCLPGLLRMPVLPTIALVQHLLGLGIVFMIGALVGHSFARWRLFIVPITVAVAVNPILLWYEHVALPETFYVFSIVATALVGLLFYRNPDKPHLIALCVALFATAGFRPEGKLFCFFGIALALAAVGLPRRHFWRNVTVLTALTVACFAINRTRQSGSLLYSNVAHLTPASLVSAPGFAEAHAAYFTDLSRRWAITPTSDIARERKKIYGLVRDYIAERKGSKAASSKAVNRLCGRIGAEVCLRSLHRLPGLAVAKFRFALRNPAAEDFGRYWVHEKQLEVLAGDADEEDKLVSKEESAAAFAAIAYGRKFQSRGELESHLHALYRPFDPDWLTQWQHKYSAGILAFRLPDRPLDDVPLYGLPILYVAAVAGLLAMALRHASLRGYHWLWLGMLLFLGFVLALTGSNLGRFRLPFEPFWVLYAVALLDAVLSFLRPRVKPRVALDADELRRGLQQPVA